MPPDTSSEHSSNYSWRHWNLEACTAWRIFSTPIYQCMTRLCGITFTGNSSRRANGRICVYIYMYIYICIYKYVYIYIYIYRICLRQGSAPGPLGRWDAKARVPGVFSVCFAESVPKSYFGDLGTKSSQRERTGTVANSKWSKKKNQHDPNGTKRGPKGCQPTQQLLQTHALELSKF